MNNEVTIHSDYFPTCLASVRVGRMTDDGRIMLCVYSGATHLQTYATRDELRELGEMLLAHAGADEVMDVAA